MHKEFHIVGRYYASVDKYGWTLLYRKTIKQGKREGELRDEILGYWGLSHLDSLLRFAAVHIASKRASTNQKLADWIDAFVQATKELQEAVAGRMPA